MERTIGHKWGQSYFGAAICDDCGARFPKELLRRNSDGFLMCRDCSPGRTRTELDDERANAVNDINQRNLDEEPGAFDAGDS